LNPEGQIQPIALTPLAPRISDGLDGKTIYVVSVKFYGNIAIPGRLAKYSGRSIPRLRLYSR
jgi:hypothetical protein